MIRRMISLLLVACMLVTVLPMDVFAAAAKGVSTTAASPQKSQNPSAIAANNPAPAVNWHRGSQNSYAALTNGTTLTVVSPQAAQNQFTDVRKTDWFYEAVMYAKQNNIFSGTDNDSFSPDGTLSRAMYVTVLGRIAGVDVSQYRTSVFKDVATDMWYAPYVAWALEKGITSGTGNGRFSPDTPITREQMATLTVKYFETYQVPYETEVQTTAQPKDLSSISSWAREAVLKLWNAGLFKGDAEGNFNPGINATRAEAAAFSMRTSETVKEWTANTQPTPSPTVTPSPTPTPTVRPGNGNTITYTITFNTNGGNAISSQMRNGGSALNNLPTPYKMNAIFIGWYKDSGLSEMISDNDLLISNMTVYAKYAASEGVSETQSIPGITKLDQTKNFTIGVDASVNRTADQVKAAMTFESPTNPDFAGITVSAISAQHFTVAAQGGAFEEGATYKLTLNDTKLSFTGEDQSTTIYTFTIAKQTVMNLGLNEGMVYIPASDVYDMTQDGESTASLSVPLAQVSNDGTDLSTVDLTNGTFTYDGTGIKVGDVVAIYEGIKPADRNLNTSEIDAGTVAYVTIMAMNGNVYSYGKADSEEVLFTPDILPVSTSADTDGDTTNDSITVDKSSMTYTGSDYAKMGLTADTTVDKGDFISFYSGTFGSTSEAAGYGKITGVSVSGGNYIITYTDATQEQITEAMDLYNQKYVDGEKLLENTDVDALEAEIEQQAEASGFVDEASKYLAALAMDTDSFKQLDSDFDLKSYNVSLSNGTQPTDDQIMLMSGSKVEVKNKKVNARLGTTLEHFAGLSGVRCALEVSCDIVIEAGDENEIVIHLAGSFEQEVRIKVGVSGGAVWKWAWIFPYIDDYRINANIDAYTYTGIRVNATIGTFEKEAEWDWDDKSKVQDIGKQIKDLMDKKDQYIGDGINTVSGTLADKYSSMLENDSDWIDVFDKELYSMEAFVDPLHILVYGIKVSFVVSAKMNISLGCDFYYENAKRYIFSIGIFSKTKSNSTVDLVEEHYQFTFYVMGTLGLRAGIRLEISAGLISLKLDSIGFVGEVGAYVQLWGYFYYELSYRASTGKTSNYSGALYLEFGIYLEISFKAQVFNGAFEYKPTLYENQWPLLNVGSQQNVYDFSYKTADTPMVSMAKQTTSFILPNSTFTMSYMDMKTGKTETKLYDDSKDFTIQMTNSDFSYDAATNKVMVTPGSKVTEDGKMIITWKGAPLAFTSAPISRTVPLHWENLNSTYSISFNSNGGSAIGAITKPYGTAIATPANPQKAGYVFGGWYRDQAFTQTYTIPATMQAADVVLYAKWEAATNTKYTVEHYQQNLVNDLYTLTDTDSLTGTTDTNVSPERKAYSGFTAPAAQSITIKADGSALLKYYYTRNSYALTFNANEGTKSSTAQIKYGTSIAVPVVTRPGYTFTGWSPAVASTMSAINTTYTAQWAVSTDTPYKVEHYQQNLNDNTYSLAEIDLLKGTTDATATATAKSYTGFTYDSNISGTVTSGAIAADGSLVLKLYYSRNTYTLIFDADGGSGGSSAQVMYGAVITVPTVTKTGYSFTGWSPAVASTMPAQDTTYTALWVVTSENMVSTLSDLETALADVNITEVIVTQAIELPDGTTLDGHDKTVRALTIGVGEDGSIQNGSDYNIFTIPSGSTATIQNLIVKGGSNTAINNAGMLNMNKVTITQSGSELIGGGGLVNTGKAVLKDCVITKNVADYGAGFVNLGSGASMILNGSSVTFNNSMLRGGGGGENKAGATLYLNNCTFANNMSSEIGGAINNYESTAYILNSTITGNMVFTDTVDVCGGGIGNNNGTLHVVNSLLTNNFEQHSSAAPQSSDIGVHSNGSGIHLYNAYCGAYVTAVTDNLAVTGDPDPANSIASTVNPDGNGLAGIFGSYAQWNSLSCPVLAKQANGTYTAPLASSSDAKLGGCDVYFDYSSGDVTQLAYGSTPIYLIGSTGGIKVSAYQGGGVRTQGVIGAFGE